MRMSQFVKECPDNPMLDIINDVYRKPKILDEIPLDELNIIFKDNNDEEIFEATAEMKHFSSGKIGYFAHGNMMNPESGAKYQIQIIAILKGS